MASPLTHNQEQKTLNSLKRAARGTDNPVGSFDGAATLGVRVAGKWLNCLTADFIAACYPEEFERCGKLGSQWEPRWDEAEALQKLVEYVTA